MDDTLYNKIHKMNNFDMINDNYWYKLVTSHFISIVV